MNPEMERFLCEVFRENGVYDQAIRQVFETELRCGGKLSFAAIELRDCLDHVAHLLKGEDFQTHSVEIRTHLYRTRSVSLEYWAEELSDQLRQRIADTDSWKKAGVDADAVKYHNAFNTACDLIAEGRARKGNRDETHMELFIKAQQIAQQAIAELRVCDALGKVAAYKNSVHTRLVAVACSVLGALIGGLISAFLRCSP